MKTLTHFFAGALVVLFAFSMLSAGSAFAKSDSSHYEYDGSGVPQIETDRA